MMVLIRPTILLMAGVFASAACGISFWLIMRHQQNMTNICVQSKIVGIIWMIPIYSIDSFLGLILPETADYVNMLRDCYEAYVLYLFLSLMLSYLGCENEECEYKLVTYLEKQPPIKQSCPCSWFCGEELPRGREFLKYCKFGTLQYCVIRPSTTLLAIVLDLAGYYHEAELDFHYGYVYILIVMNLSIGYAFVVLASFYTAMKSKLKPYEPVGKFLCIKFVIFFAFWQSVVITGLVKIGVITGMGGYDARQVSTGMQNFLICIEMFFAAVAFTYTFGYEPFTEGYVNPRTTAQLYESSGEYDTENAAALERFMQATDNDMKMDGSNSSCSAGSLWSYLSPTAVDPTQARSQRSSGSSRDRMQRKNGRSVGFPFPVGGSSSTHSSRVPARAERAGVVTGPLGSTRRTASGAPSYHLIEMTQDDQPSPASTSASNNNYASPEARRIGSDASSSSHRGISSADRRHEQRMSAQTSTNTSAAGRLLNQHFAADAAIRDFNETMPVLVLPSGFEMHRGLVVNSDPEARLHALEEENRRLNAAEASLK